MTMNFGPRPYASSPQIYASQQPALVADKGKQRDETSWDEHFATYDAVETIGQVAQSQVSTDNHKTEATEVDKQVDKLET